MDKRPNQGVGAVGGGLISYQPAAKARIQSSTVQLLQPYQPPAAATALAVAAPASAGAVSGAPGTVPVLPARPAVRRGCLAEALRTAESDELMEAALGDLDRDRYAETSTKSRASWLRTWVTMHQAAFQRFPNPPGPFPLTCDSIRRVAALFKAGGYLSFVNYAMRAKSEHLSLQLHGHGAWSMEHGPWS